MNQRIQLRQQIDTHSNLNLSALHGLYIAEMHNQYLINSEYPALFTDLADKKK